MASALRLRQRIAGATIAPLISRKAPRQPILHHISRRHASSASSESLLVSRVKTILYTSAIAVSGYVAYMYATDTRASIHTYVTPPLLRLLFPDAEDAHNAAVSSMKTLYNFNLHPRERGVDGPSSQHNPDIAVSVFGTTLANPVGISAGLDKHADIPDPLFALGASVVEVGGCTPLAQDGNPRPRMFRIPVLDGLVNRYGLNSHGADNMAMRLRERVRYFARKLGVSEEDVLNGNLEVDVPPGSLQPGHLLAVQIAKNKVTDEKDVEAVSRDYVYCVSRLGKYADIIVVNVSSPNTPGLRDLQAVEPLTRILSAVVDEAARTDRKTKPKVMVKVSPDENEESQMQGIVQAVWESGVDGVIVGNTTKIRTGIVPPGIRLEKKEAEALTETGGYSGPLMFDRTLDLVGRYRKMLDGVSFRDEKLPVEETKAEEGRKVAEEAVTASIAALDGIVTGTAEEYENQPKPTKSAALEPKVIFATGGITNGSQALRILNAGASVAMVYTGLVYGGAGTITRIKGEMKHDMVQKKE